MALIAAYVNAGVTLVVTVKRYVPFQLFPHLLSHVPMKTYCFSERKTIKEEREGGGGEENMSLSFFFSFSFLVIDDCYKCEIMKRGHAGLRLSFTCYKQFQFYLQNYKSVCKPSLCILSIIITVQWRIIVRTTHFLLQDEKNQIMTTNVWLRQVSGQVK